MWDDILEIALDVLGDVLTVGQERKAKGRRPPEKRKPEKAGKKEKEPWEREDERPPWEK